MLGFVSILYSQQCVPMDLLEFDGIRIIINIITYAMKIRWLLANVRTQWFDYGRLFIQSGELDLIIICC